MIREFFVSVFGVPYYTIRLFKDRKALKREQAMQAQQIHDKAM